MPVWRALFLFLMSAASSHAQQITIEAGGSISLHAGSAATNGGGDATEVDALKSRVDALEAQVANLTALVASTMSPAPPPPPSTPDGLCTPSMAGANTLDVSGTSVTVVCQDGWTLIQKGGTSYSPTAAQSPGETTDVSACTSNHQSGCYLSRAVVVQLASIASQVMLQDFGSSAFGSAGASTQVSDANDGAIQALRTPASVSSTACGMGNWHRGACGTTSGLGNDIYWTPAAGSSAWQWEGVTCSYTTEMSQGGWPQMFHGCGNGNGVAWGIGDNGPRYWSGLGGSGHVTATWLK